MLAWHKVKINVTAAKDESEIVTKSATEAGAKTDSATTANDNDTAERKKKEDDEKMTQESNNNLAFLKNRFISLH